MGETVIALATLIVGLILGIPVVLACAYLLVLTLLSARPGLPEPAIAALRFDVIVPAHDEQAVIARTVASLRAIEWPAELFRVLVVADNCTDDTATIARSSGAMVLERDNPTLRGKGYALEFAFAHSMADGRADAIVVVDADSVVSPNLLAAFAARLARGAQAVQCHYGVLNPHDSWRTRLMSIALACFHIVRSRARARIGASCGIRGNGWCVTPALLRRVPFRAFSLAEDIEFGIDLALVANVPVAYADEASVLGEMVTSASAAKKQRQRWEGGRVALIRERIGPLLRGAVTRPSIVCLDLALDLLVLPLSYIVLGVAALGGYVALLALSGLPARPLVTLFAFCAASLAGYVARGWGLSGVGWRGVVDFARVPFFIVWKLAAVVRSRVPDQWIRTERNRP